MLTKGDSKSGRKERAAPVPPPSSGERVWAHSAPPPSTAHIPRRSDAGGCLCVVFLQSPASSICSPQPSQCGSPETSGKDHNPFLLGCSKGFPSYTKWRGTSFTQYHQSSGPHPALCPFKLTLSIRRAELPPQKIKRLFTASLSFMNCFLPSFQPSPRVLAPPSTELTPHPHIRNLTAGGVCSLSGVTDNSFHPPCPHSKCFLCRHDLRDRRENRASSSPHNTFKRSGPSCTVTNAAFRSSLLLWLPISFYQWRYLPLESVDGTWRPPPSSPIFLPSRQPLAPPYASQSISWTPYSTSSLYIPGRPFPGAASPPLWED